jgi:hypothetical protein
MPEHRPLSFTSQLTKWRAGILKQRRGRGTFAVGNSGCYVRRD